MYGFIGCGNMGGVLAAVAAKSVGGENVMTADFDKKKTAALQETYGTMPVTSTEIAATCKFVVLGVKPQVVPAVAEEIRDILAARSDRFVVVSMAAGVRAADVSELLGGCAVIRIMPNTPAAVGEGVIHYCPYGGVTDEEEAEFRAMFEKAGVLVKLDESRIDAACAVTGCGPAFVCMFLEGMIDGAVRLGLTHEQAVLFAEQTVIGTAKLALDTKTDPAQLRANVCSPGGSTIEGVAALEDRAFRAAIMDAIDAAYRRTLELGKK
ncbi:MAG: pyrroline-5-carboxylate reductase [Oscillospiraceae bacterium]|nr:pyrroline-5-carboxylate reductase [Oscillospiraceae bacterium]